MERLWGLVSFLVALAIVVLAVGAFGALGPFELIVAIAIAIPIGVLVYRLTIGRVRAVLPQG